jgi:hypothetical protein
MVHYMFDSWRPTLDDLASLAVPAARGESAVTVANFEPGVRAGSLAVIANLGHASAFFNALGFLVVSLAVGCHSDGSGIGEAVRVDEAIYYLVQARIVDVRQHVWRAEGDRSVQGWIVGGG